MYIFSLNKEKKTHNIKDIFAQPMAALRKNNNE